VFWVINCNSLLFKYLTLLIVYLSNSAVVIMLVLIYPTQLQIMLKTYFI